MYQALYFLRSRQTGAHSSGASVCRISSSRRTTINPRKQAVHLPQTYFRAVVEADDDSLVYVVRVPAKHEGLRSVEMHRSLEALDVP
jgi:hypothetical protein